MKRSRLLEIIREEIRTCLREYGSESMYYSAPGGFEQIGNKTIGDPKRFYDAELWKVTAMQLGAVITDRGDDFIAVLPNQTKIGTFNKMTSIGTLTI